MDWRLWAIGIVCLYMAWIAGPARAADQPGVDGDKDFASKPYMGWSSWSSLHKDVSEAIIKAQADVLDAKLKPFGYVYVNIDAGWEKGVDEAGRPKPNPKRFPNGMVALASYLHERGLKFGLYLNPGVPKAAWDANSAIAGTSFHVRDIADSTQPGNTLGRDAYKIDFSRPGAKDYIQSLADQYASWGVDFLKIDFVGPGGGRAKKVDNREEIHQWAAAIKQTGRPIWLELSNSLSFQYAREWRKYANGWRIDGDVEDYRVKTLTSWDKLCRRFDDAPQWAPFAGAGGWNDLDALEIGNGDSDGLTPDERRSVMTLWCISCSPLFVGADLTKLDPADYEILTNAEAIAVDQAGRPAKPLDEHTNEQVWTARNADGSYTVALFNLGEDPATVSVAWHDLNVAGKANIRDLWSHTDLPPADDGFSDSLDPHACRLLKVRPMIRAATQPAK